MNIKEVRNEVKFSRENLAKLLDVNPTTIYRWEKGTATPPQKEEQSISIMPMIRKDKNLTPISTQILIGVGASKEVFDHWGIDVPVPSILGIPAKGVIDERASQMVSRPDLLLGAATYMLHLPAEGVL